MSSAKHVTVYASAARTATPTAVTIPTGRYKYLDLVIDTTAHASTPSVTVAIDGYDTVSGKYYNLLTSAAQDGTAQTTVIRVGPGLAASSNVVADYALPSTIKVTCTHSDSDSITYSVGAHLMAG